MESEFVIKKTIRFVFLFVFILLSTFMFSTFACAKQVFAMPFYDLQPKQLVLRSSFYTSYINSTEERKSNIKLCAKSIDNTLIDVGGEFSFNNVVGARTEKRGYKRAKIIVNGEFVDGVGGGVCQVSTTLYNAVLLADLQVLECHAHSLPVSYVVPSFDAMVNSGWADLKFKNNTKNPVYLKAQADDEKIKISIYGQAMHYKINRVSNIVGKIMPLPEQIIFDDKGEYPQLYEGEKKFLRYGKEGIKSEGYIEKIINGKVIQTKKVRKDSYSAIRGLIIYGRAIKSANDLEQEDDMIEQQKENSLP